MMLINLCVSMCFRYADVCFTCLKVDQVVWITLFNVEKLIQVLKQVRKTGIFQYFSDIQK